MKFSSKLPEAGTTVFTVMSELARRHGAINLAQGFPDFDAPRELLDLACEHIHAGRNQYAPMTGLPELREQISRKAELCYRRVIDPVNEITITSGATEALFSAIMALVQTGDEVIVFDPAYDSYVPAIRLAGGKEIRIPLTAPDFGIDWDRVRTLVSKRTRLIIVNSPHNPSGAVLSQDDIKALAAIVSDSDIVILSDEVYEHIIFDGARHESLLRTELAARSLVVGSFGKTFHMTGWKIGYCIAPPQLTDEFRRIHQFVQFCVATPLQAALADFLRGRPEHWQELGNFYVQKRDYFVQLLASSRFEIRPSAGTYFQLADFSGISAESDETFAHRLTVEHGVAAIPVSVFYASPPNQHLVRFCFAKNNETLERAAEILCAI